MAHNNVNSKICQELWSLDERLNAPKDYQIAPHADKLFVEVSNESLSRSLFQKFQDVVSIYHSDRETMVYTDDEKRRQTDFIKAVMSTKVMQRCFSALKSSGKFSGSGNDFENQLYALWFHLHGQHQIDTCTFEHVFVGERAGYEVEGFHNWIQYYLQQRKGTITNYHFTGKSKVDGNTRLLALKFDWNGKAKNKDGLFIGTTPAFEMALYVYLFYAGETTANGGQGRNHIQLGDMSLQVEVVVRDSRLVTAYPIA